VTVPEGTCFVLGDNRENSRDSRHFGPVPLGDVVGVAEYVYLPGDTWSRFGALP
jgi:signal peptidase I